MTFKTGVLEESSRAWFSSINPGFEPTGETLIITADEGGPGERSCAYVVFKATGKQYTPYDMVRDCGDHYIKAQWSRYDRIDKGTFKVTRDVDDR